MIKVLAIHKIKPITNLFNILNSSIVNPADFSINAYSLISYHNNPNKNFPVKIYRSLDVFIKQTTTKIPAATIQASITNIAELLSVALYSIAAISGNQSVIFITI